MEASSKQYDLGDICVQYTLDTESGAIGLTLMPAGWQKRCKPKRQQIDPLIQLMIRGDDFPPGFANGHTLRGNGSLSRFSFLEQMITDSDGHKSVLTRLKADGGHELEHRLTYHEGAEGVEIETSYKNNGVNDVTLDMLTSFCLGGITPFIEADAPESMVLHRLRSKWSNEARLESIAIEDLQLEPSWSGYGAASEKFGQVGSMPVRKFFPFAAVEDTLNHVIWGVQLACPSSWQIEAYRRDDGLCLSGGLADYDFGHSCKTVKPGESISAPVAYVTVCEGGIDEVCQRLVSMRESAPKRTESLPIVFNEFCTTWGNPSQENIERALAALKGRDIDYFVIDSGWYADESKGWEANMGDWEINQKLFPDGLASVADAIRSAGMKPGIWFEPEVCGRDAKAFGMTEHLLKRNGIPITVGNRRFWDMRSEWVCAYLEERVIGLLKQYGFEYVKIDYNDSIGIGCDGAESLGEGLRQNMLASREFFKKIGEEIPGIVIENCSSGGHRLEPSFMDICPLSSFSDAHEEREIPIIAANLHRVMPPGKSLIWAVLRKDDSAKRLVWSLCATFLGVMCLSGDVFDLNPKQWEIVDKAIGFYRTVSPVIQNGVTKRFGPAVKSYRHLKGWQAVERVSPDKGKKLIVAHVFDDEVTEIKLALGGEYRIRESFAEDSAYIRCDGGALTLRLEDGACAVYLTR